MLRDTVGCYVVKSSVAWFSWALTTSAGAATLASTSVRAKVALSAPMAATFHTIPPVLQSKPSHNSLV
eukprot:1924612-Pyramimonas_sp.AAC.1